MRSRLVLVFALVLQLVAAAPSRQAAAVAPFTFRGVVEGYFGIPWTHPQRVDSLRWMGAHSLNTYVTGGADDHPHKRNWRDPFSPQRLNEYLEQIAVAREAGVEWVPDLRPGLPIFVPTPDPAQLSSRDVCFSCPQDREVIYAKFGPLFQAGVRTMAIFFDDVVKASTHPEDVLTYGAGDEAYGRMNRDLLNAVYRHYSSRAAPGRFTLLAVGADYSGTADTPYLRGLREGGGLDSGIEIMWTGRAVLPKTIETAEAAAYAALVGKEKILIWDNYPVNDVTGGGAFGVDPEYPETYVVDTRIFLGPYEGRAPDLPQAVSGVIANPMSDPVASRIALGTMADYLADPASYQPEPAWRAAIADLAGGDPALIGALAALAENSRSSTLNRTESPVFVELRDAFLAALDDPFWTGAWDDLMAELRREREAPGVLRRNARVLAAETEGFLTRLKANAVAAAAATRLLSAQRPRLRAQLDGTTDGRVRVQGRARAPSAPGVAALLADLNASFGATADIHSMHGDRVAQDISNVYVNENRVDAFVAEAEARTARWLPQAPLATSSVTVTVQGVEVPVDASGRFAAEVAGSPGLVEVVATDGAGGATGLLL